jgi:hypothetical protein
MFPELPWLPLLPEDPFARSHSDALPLMDVRINSQDSTLAIGERKEVPIGIFSQAGHRFDSFCDAVAGIITTTDEEIREKQKERTERREAGLRKNRLGSTYITHQCMEGYKGILGAATVRPPVQCPVICGLHQRGIALLENR